VLRCGVTASTAAARVLCKATWTKFLHVNPQVIAAIIAGSLTLIGTLAAQIFGRRATGRDIEQQTRDLDYRLMQQRELILNERFTGAANQLGGEPSAVRLAGVYAMAGLADDWAEDVRHEVAWCE
jgi:hypothetical protein